MVQAVIQTTVTGLQGNPVATTTPGVNQALVWNGTAWAPAGPYLPISGGVLTGAITPAGIIGITTGAAVPAGQVGEVISAQITTPANPASQAWTTISSISLTPGDWDISGCFTSGASVFIGSYQAGIALAANSAPSSSNTLQSGYIQMGGGSNEMQFMGGATGIVRVNIAAATSYFMNINVTYPSGFVNAFGSITARRMR